MDLPRTSRSKGRIVGWLAFVICALAVTVQVVSVGGPPTGDEGVLAFGFVALLLVLAVPTAALLPKRSLNAALFAGFTSIGLFAKWVQVESLALALIMFGLVWLMNAIFLRTHGPYNMPFQPTAGGKHLRGSAAARYARRG